VEVETVVADEIANVGTAEVIVVVVVTTETVVNVIVVRPTVSIVVVKVKVAEAVFMGMLRHKHALEIASFSSSFKYSGIVMPRPTISAAG
jgi:hypothetical protein